jgi:DNA helicase MCM9
LLLLELKVQEQVKNLGFGTMPRSLCIILENDLVDSCKAGDDVRVAGIVKTRWQSNKEGERCRVELVLHGTFVEVTNEQKFAKAALDEETIKSFEQ